MNQKPIQLIREEFAVKLSELINDTPLPAFVKLDILNDVVQNLTITAIQEYEQAKTYWEKEKNKGGEVDG